MARESVSSQPLSRKARAERRAGHFDKTDRQAEGAHPEHTYEQQSTPAPTTEMKVTQTAASQRPKRDIKQTQRFGVSFDPYSTPRSPINKDHLRSKKVAPAAKTGMKPSHTPAKSAAMIPKKQPSKSGLKSHPKPIVQPLADYSGDHMDLATDAPRNTQLNQSTLLLARLPGELRNKIYRYVLCSATTLQISGSQPQQPSLLRTCRQIRQECIRIFYSENSFACTIVNYDPTEFKKYRKVGDQYGLSTVLLTHRHEQHAPRALLRTNFLMWLEQAYRGDTAPLGYSNGHTEDTYQWKKLSHRIVKIFNMTKELKRMGLQWQDVRPVMEAAVDAAGVCGENVR